jgi:hypothetical protein
MTKVNRVPMNLGGQLDLGWEEEFVVRWFLRNGRGALLFYAPATARRPPITTLASPNSV